MTTGTLIIFSGLPGAGKSTLAAQLATKLNAAYLRIDTIEQGLREVCGIAKIDGSGYQLAHRIAKENLLLGNVVVADSVNPWDLTRSEWNKVAQEIGAEFFNIEIICSNRREHQERIESRTSSIPGLCMPTWRDVLQRNYQPWTGERLVVDTAGKVEQDCLSEIGAALRRQLSKQEKLDKQYE